MAFPPSPASAAAPAGAPRPLLWARPSWSLLAFALVLATARLLPFWHAQAVTPPGWEFTGNLSVSDDHSQYRVWERQVLEEGPLVRDRWTSEPNRPHLLVLPYWVVGHLAHWLGVAPERVFVFAGSPLAVLLVIAIFNLIHHFLPDRRQAWAATLAALLGGGLGAHLKILNELPVLQARYVWQRLVSEPLAMVAALEDYRGNYLVTSLLDTHYVIVWLVALGAMAAFLAALRRGGWRTGVAALAFAGITLLHVYEGVTLVVVAATIVACTWTRLDDRRRALRLLEAVTAAVLACYLVLGRLVAASGLPLPAWRAPLVPLLPFLIGYPLGFGLLAWRGATYWRTGGVEARALCGWILGCAIVTLSGPFYPYPDRGTLTLQVPLMIVAVAIAARELRPLRRRHVALAVLLLAGTPAWLVAHRYVYTRFRPTAPYMFLGPDHRAVLAELDARATPRDVLVSLVEDARWLAPTYRGVHWAGHFFLTVDFERKHAALEDFLRDGPRADPSFLARAGTRWLFVNAEHQPARFEHFPGLRPVVRTDAGWLFVHEPAPDAVAAP